MWPKEIHDDEFLVEQAMESRWYSLRRIYAIKLTDDQGNFTGYMTTLFVDKAEAYRVAKKASGIVVEYGEIDND